MDARILIGIVLVGMVVGLTAAWFEIDRLKAQVRGLDSFDCELLRRSNRLDDQINRGDKQI